MLGQRVCGRDVNKTVWISYKWGKRMKILIVDDSDDVRLSLRLFLKKWNHEVVEAMDGKEGWQMLQENQDISFVISDWSMPEMTGVELCQVIRKAALGRYIYIILLTANTEKGQVIEGIESGADDFIGKPFNQNELRVRIHAGERVLQLERELAERNQTLVEYNRKLEEAYAQIRIDLEAAARLQRQLLPDSARDKFAGVGFDRMYMPSAFVAGDTLNFFQLDEHHVGFYMIDVAGHGIASALMSITTHKILTPEYSIRGRENILKHTIEQSPYYEIRPPAQVITELNESSQQENDAMQYFTMVYAVLNTQTGVVTMSQAGHPAPVLVRTNGEVVQIGSGGFPVGMLPGMVYEELTETLYQGDRLYLYTDGITECPNPGGEQFSEERFVRLLSEEPQIPIEHVLEKIESALIEWRGSTQFDDDISLLAVEKH